MTLNSKVKDFWTRFLQATDRPEATRPFEVFSFADSKEVANELAALVMAGKKTATASLLWEYDRPDKRPPVPGDLSIVTNWDGQPICVIETTKVTVRPFQDVDEAFAAAEGEGDRSLKYWRKAHWACFERVCRDLERERSPSMPVVCERFKVLKPRRKRVYAYITNHDRLLVFTHANSPEAGIQVPAGTVVAGENPESAVMREVREETGMTYLRMVSFLGAVEKDMSPWGTPEIQEASFFHIECPGRPNERWQHAETSGGTVEPILFDFHWAQLPDQVPELIALNGALLPKLVQTMKKMF